jgi:hypothetical protein
MKMTERHSYAANAAQRQPVRVTRDLDNKSKGTLARQQDQTEDDWKRPQILPNRTLPDNGCSRFNRSARYHEQGRAVDACTFCNASTGLVKRTSDCRCRPHRRKTAGSSQEKNSGALRPQTNEKSRVHAFAEHLRSQFRRVPSGPLARRVHYFPDITASPRWLFCEPRADAVKPYPFVILSKLSPRYGDHARLGILHVSHNQGE